MASLSPIPIGLSNRLETTFNLKSGTSMTDSIFDGKSVASKVLQTTGHGPILSYAKNTSLTQDTVSSRFGKDNKLLYTKISAKTEGGTGFLSFGPSQPYVSVNPNSSTKRIKKYDSRMLPIGSVIQDTVRIAKFTVSGAGLLFNIKQFMLQGQNAFNETQLYNPLSVIQSTIRPTTFGLVPRPNRHITMGSGLLGTFLGTLGLKDNTGTPPKGTAADKDKLNTLPDSNAKQAKGLIRAQTGSNARQNILLKYGGGSTKKGSFLGNLAKKLFPMFAKKPDQFDKVGGNTKYRADQDLYEQFIKYYKDQASKHPHIYNNFVQEYTANDYNSDETRIPGLYSDNGNSYQYAIDIKKKKSDKIVYEYDGTKLMRMYSDLFYSSVGKNNGYIPSYKSFLSKNFQIYIGNQIGGTSEVSSKPDDIESAQKRKFSSNGITYYRKGRNSITYDQLHTKMKDKEDRWSTIVNGSMREEGNALISNPFGKGFPRENGTDAINMQDILSTEPRAKSDQIAFWFYDVVNKKYLQFRAVISGISDQNSIEWNEINYVGMPDKVYHYKGFTRTLGFSFIAYVNSVKELHPMWKKINYLMSFKSPSNYISGKYAVPPIIQLRIGDMYHNLPIVINSLNLTVPDDTTWETLPATDIADYHYMAGMIKVPNVRYGQFPTRVEIQVGAYVLEQENYPRIGNTVFGPSQGEDTSNASNFHLRSFDNKDNIVNGVLVN